MKKRQIKKWHWWVLMGVVGALTYLLYMFFAKGQSIWFDEGYSILLAKNDIGTLLLLTAVDAHPPLYYLALKLWGELFGYTEFALRSLSALLMAGAGVTALCLTRRLFSTKVALLVIPFIIFAPFLIRYGYEVRMYALATLIGVTGTYTLIWAQAGKSYWRWALYAVLVAAGMYTLYMTLVIWLAHVVWLLVGSLRKERLRDFWRWPWLRAFVIAVILFLPYAPVFFYQLTNSALPGIGKELTLTQLVDATSILTLYTPEWSLGGWLSLVLILAIGLTVFVGIRGYQRLGKEQRGYYLLLALLVVVPLVFYALTSLPPREPIFINRYLAHVSLFIYLFIGSTLAIAWIYRSKEKMWIRRTIIFTYIFVVAILAFGTVRLYQAGNFNFERMQYPETALLREEIDCDAQTVIVADDPYTYIDSVFYFDGCELRFYSASDVEIKGGYAPLSGSDRRIVSSEDVDATTLIRLGWEGNEPQFAPDARYELISTDQYGKQLVETYQLTSE